MTRRRVLALAALVAGAAATLGYGAYQWWRGAMDSQRVAIDALFSTPLANLSGGHDTLEKWRGQVLVVNFWATWCAPCREEIPLFVQMQKRLAGRGLQFIGIAIDRPVPVAAFQREYAMNYPVLIGGIETMELLRASGNRNGVLPFTLIIDRSGQVVKNKLGTLKEHELEAVVTPLF